MTKVATDIFNTRTKESFWERQKILGSDEVPLTPRSQVVVDQLFSQANQGELQQAVEEGKMQQEQYPESKMIDETRPMTSESNIRPMTSESNLRPMTSESNLRPTTGESSGLSKNTGIEEDSDADSDDEDRPETAMTKYSSKQAILSLEDQEAIKAQQLDDFLESEDY